MWKIDSKEFFRRIADTAFQLVKYIYRVQGLELRRLDFKAAAAELGVERADIVTEYERLCKVGIIITKDKKLRLDEKIIKADN